MAKVKDALFKAWGSFHEAVLRTSKGKVLGRGMGMPMLILTTTGAKTGQQRTTVLSSPLVEGDTVVLVASFGGDDRDPAWYRNLVENPDVEIDLEGEHREMTARVADPDERAHLWTRITDEHKNYASYQRRTDRVIPVVVLEPRAA